MAALSFGGLGAGVIVICGNLLYDTFYPLPSQPRTPYFYPKHHR